MNEKIAHVIGTAIGWMIVIPLCLFCVVGLIAILFTQYILGGVFLLSAGWIGLGWLNWRLK